MTENEIQNEKKIYKTGMICAVVCMVFWGFMPIYWKSLLPIESSVIILYRIVLVGVTSFVAAVKVYGIEGIKEPFKDKKTILKLFFTGLVVTFNWSIYIYAINSGQAIQACIGYYMDPLMVCVFGMIFFKERPTKYKTVAISLGCLGLLIVLVYFMKMPLIALSLALTFTVYTAMKKYLKMRALVSLFYETVFISPVALGVILYLEINGKGALVGGMSHQFVLLLFAGLLTAAPLTMFAVAANRISMISLGILEYIGPSITLVIGIFMFKEPFDLVQFLSFCVIWIGFVFFTYGEIKEKGKP